MEIVYNGLYGKTTQRIRAQAKIELTQDQKTFGNKTRDADQKTQTQVVPKPVRGNKKQPDLTRVVFYC